MTEKTYIFDTNVYGELVIERDSLDLIKRIKEDLAHETYVFVNRINELKTPKLVDYFDFIKRYKK